MKVKELKKILEAYDEDAIVSFVNHGRHFAILNHQQSGKELELSGPNLSQLVKNMELFTDVHNDSKLLDYCEKLYRQGIPKDILIYCLEVLLKWVVDSEELEENVGDVLSLLLGWSPAHYSFPFFCVPCFSTPDELLTT